MNWTLPLFPTNASTMAGQVDTLYLFLIAVSGLAVTVIALLILFFGVRYRRRAPDQSGSRVVPSLGLEIGWSILPLLVGLVMFAWGANVYFAQARPPAETMDIYVVGKQWMWKFQHPAGQREINELHVPVGRAVRLTATSEDVIHSFFVPAFRMKADVIPGRYTTLWFNATKPGEYHLFCAEYCGTQHSGMIGKIVVMEPNEFQAWLSGGAAEGSMASQGQKLFQDFACNTCHLETGQGRGPSLQGLYGTEVELASGQAVTADDAYIRESVLSPAAKIVAGFQPIMPTFQGLITEEQLLALIEYVKSLQAAQTRPGAQEEPGPQQRQPGVQPPQPGSQQKQPGTPPGEPRN
ncbi:MAG TPA: cytochrome c oxidase subunit II [Vicinamibacterales bacterium]|nr:cytochrome c oxidase subunit II [Vicinamibacterales bacterium]